MKECIGWLIWNLRAQEENNMQIDHDLMGKKNVISYNNRSGSSRKLIEIFYKDNIINLYYYGNY